MEAREGPLATLDSVRVVTFSADLPEVETFEKLPSSESEGTCWVSSGRDGEDDDEPFEVNAKLVEAVDARKSSNSSATEGSMGLGASSGGAGAGDEDDHDGDDEDERLAANPFEGAVERRRIRRCATVGMGARPDFQLRSLPIASRLWQRRRV